jgi:hypothetical protein
MTPFSILEKYSKFQPTVSEEVTQKFGFGVPHPLGCVLEGNIKTLRHSRYLLDLFNKKTKSREKDWKVQTRSFDYFIKKLSAEDTVLFIETVLTNKKESGEVFDWDLEWFRHSDIFRGFLTLYNELTVLYGGGLVGKFHATIIFILAAYR